MHIVSINFQLNFQTRLYFFFVIICYWGKWRLKHLWIFNPRTHSPNCKHNSIINSAKQSSMLNLFSFISDKFGINCMFRITARIYEGEILKNLHFFCRFFVKKFIYLLFIFILYMLWFVILCLVTFLFFLLFLFFIQSSFYSSKKTIQ